MSLAEAAALATHRQDDAVADVLRKLAVVWTEFEGRLEATPLIRKLTRGRFELADYHAFLVNLRQQVKDGSLWMSRAASSIGEEHLELRSTLMKHAVDRAPRFPHAGGGLRGERRRARRHPECARRTSARRRSRPGCFTRRRGPIRSACSARCSSSRAWARSRRRNGAAWRSSRLGLPEDAFKFLLYHGENDAEHMQEFEEMLRLVLPDEAVAARIVTCAKVTARLYALQIEEIVA